MTLVTRSRAKFCHQMARSRAPFCHQNWIHKTDFNGNQISSLKITHRVLSAKFCHCTTGCMDFSDNRTSIKNHAPRREASGMKNRFLLASFNAKSFHGTSP